MKPGVEAQAFIGELAPFGAALVKFWVREDVAAPNATAPGIIFEKLDLVPAGRAGNLENIPRPPESSVLAWAHDNSHNISSFHCVSGQAQALISSPKR
jgi:hypothetical protein